MDTDDDMPEDKPLEMPAYLLTDTSTGKRYVGSYGEFGI